MASWRKFVVAALLFVAVSSLTVSLSGCGDSGQTAAGPNPEVKIEAPKDASGKEFRIEDEAASPK